MNSEFKNKIIWSYRNETLTIDRIVLSCSDYKLLWDQSFVQNTNIFFNKTHVTLSLVTTVLYKWELWYDCVLDNYIYPTLFKWSWCKHSSMRKTRILIVLFFFFLRERCWTSHDFRLSIFPQKDAILASAQTIFICTGNSHTIYIKFPNTDETRCSLWRWQPLRQYSSKSHQEEWE